MTDRHTVDSINSDQLDALYDERDRLRAGEEPGWDPLTVPTPGQWIARFNQASPAERLDAAERIIANAATAGHCFLMAHEKRLDEDRHAWVTLARVQDVRDKWALYTLEPGQVRRLLDDLTHALAEPANNGEQPARTTPNNPATSGNSPDNPASWQPDETLDYGILPPPAVDPNAPLRTGVSLSPKEQLMPACTATIEGPHVPGDQPIQCTREAGHPENHVGPNQDGDGRTLWTDHNAGATPHRADTEEQR
jgi:hypothetical protein